MPNGNVHRNLTKIVTVSSVPLYFWFDPLIVTGVLVGELVTLGVNPDCDITINRVGIYKWLGFDAYNRLISHRAGLRWSNWRDFSWKSLWKLLFFSHFPVTGTLLRFLIVLYLPLILLMLVSMLKIWVLWFIIGLFIGMCLSDGVHIGADIVWSGLRKMFPFLKRFDDNYVPYKKKGKRQWTPLTNHAKR
jgi:hypothetical protein